MKFIFEWMTENRITARAITMWIATLGYESSDNTMEYRSVVITFHTQLNEIAACQRCLSAP